MIPFFFIYILEANPDTCDAKKSDLTYSLRLTDDDELRNNLKLDINFPSDRQDVSNCFIHEPEEISALCDSRTQFPTISPIFDDEMESNKTQFINDKVFKLTVNDENKTAALSEKDDLIPMRRQSLQSLDELESDLSTNKYTDADVLNAVSVFSARASPVDKTNDALPEKQVNGKLEKFCHVSSFVFCRNF